MDKVIVRYSLIADDSNGNIDDINRIAEFICSIISVKVYLQTLIPLHYVIYTEPRCAKRLDEILQQLDLGSYELVQLTNEHHKAISDQIVNCSMVDRICIRRMLHDFCNLPSNEYRLFIGTDCYFNKYPYELLKIINDKSKNYIAYMADDVTFRGEKYKLRYYKDKILEGFVGDFYLLAPGVVLSESDIEDMLKRIDGWPLFRRWEPNLPWHSRNKVHACEQQATAILLAQYPAYQLPNSSYTMNCITNSTVVLHSHHPWSPWIFPYLSPELRRLTLYHWDYLGYTEISYAATHPPQQNEFKKYIWKCIDKFISFFEKYI